MRDFEELSQRELQTLYLNFVHYRDSNCNGHALMGIRHFYQKFGLQEYKADVSKTETVGR